MKTSNIQVTEPSPDYELVDSGMGEKLERYGKFTLLRPDPQALWSKKLSERHWKSAQGKFIRSEAQGSWSLEQGVPDRWEVSLGGLRFWIRPTAFKHTGVFPEQTANWEWIRENIKYQISKNENSQATGDARSDTGHDVEVLNLFGYTGGATLTAAEAGARVVHVDGSKAAITWARENAELSGLDKKPIRWILEDVRSFVRREIKRGRQYDGIIMDPPSFGHGPENELWKIEDDLAPLIADCFSILKPEPLFFLVNGYAAGYSAIAYENMLFPLVSKRGGTVETGELTIKESNSESKEPARLLPAGIYARWAK